ncbi:MAG: hypothetical protein ACREHC_01305 [Candidatus Levyibacteriota bacterium]
MYILAIVLHASSGVIAFVLGIVFLFQHNLEKERKLMKIILVCLVLLEVFLAGAIILHFDKLSVITRLTYGSLALLGLYMILRAVQGIRVLLKQTKENKLPIIDHIGFILISLFEGFSIVTAVDLKAPGWLIGVVAVGAVILGINYIKAQKRKLLT